MARLLSGRTDNAIKNHWNSTLKRKCISDELSGSPAKKTVNVTDLCFSPGSPSGSDVSDSSLPVVSSHVYRPVARTGRIVPPAIALAQIEALSSTNDPPTSLSLSLPGAGFSENEISNPSQLLRRSSVYTQPSHLSSFAPAEEAVPVAGAASAGSTVTEKGLSSSFPFSPEFLAVVQDMIAKDVRSYMAGFEQNGFYFMRESDSDAFDAGGASSIVRNVAVKRIGISKLG